MTPHRSNRFILSWDTFPPSFKDDADALLARLAAGDPRGTGFVRPARPLTVSLYQLEIRQVASALVHRGHDPKSIQSLRDLVAVNAVNEWVKFFRDRQSGSSTSRIHHMIGRFNTIARYWVKIDREHLERLKKIARYFSPKDRGIRERDRARLRPFADPANVRALFKLPQSLIQHVAKKDKGTAKWARRVMVAVAIELLLLGPIRIGLLPGLQLGRHIRIGPRRTVRVFIPAEEATRRVDLSFALPESSSTMMRLYVQKYRPRLTDIPEGWLFPGLKNGPISRQGLTSAIRIRARRAIDLDVHPHLLRQIGIKLFLDRNPNGLEIVRQVMGFSSTEAVTRACREFLTPAQVRRFDRRVLKLHGKRTSMYEVTDV